VKTKIVSDNVCYKSNENVIEKGMNLQQFNEKEITQQNS
jgi:hypothetical protein